MKYPGQSRRPCPCCESRRINVFYEADAVPVNSVLLLGTRREAEEFPTGDIRLGFCENCGFIYNCAFNARLVEYSSRYEETQGFSPLFRQWHERMARRLIDRHDLQGKKIAEIGCGKGEFLSLLCQLGNSRGIGFDPAFVPERDPSMNGVPVEFIRDYYSEKYAGHGADFLCCKMTLEHIADASSFTEMVRRSVADAPDTTVFFQVPDTLRILRELAFWDIYYEHCSYYSAGSFARLFRRVGFDVLEIAREYDDQYLTLEACPTGRGSGPCLPLENDVDTLKELVAFFAAGVSKQLSEWRNRLRRYRLEECRIVIWGSGSKAVAFLTTLKVPDVIDYVVDINPHKEGHYMAGTGQQIVAPAFLRDYRPHVVIVMNPIYRDEIAAQLRQYHITPEIITT